MANNLTINGVSGEPTGGLDPGQGEGPEPISILPWLIEAQRQATIASKSLEQAIRDGLVADPQDPGDTNNVWQSVQAGLFAAIIVNRLVSAPDRRTSNRATGAQKRRTRELNNFGAKRASLMLEALDIAKDSHILKIRGVRNSIEHIDERMDEQTFDGARFILDFNIGQPRFSSANSEGGSNFLRVFSPAAGVLRFGPESFIDIFALDVELIRIAQCSFAAVTKARATLANDPLNHYPSLGLIVEEFPSGECRARVQHWMQQRWKLDHPVAHGLDLSQLQGLEQLPWATASRRQSE